MHYPSRRNASPPTTQSSATPFLILRPCGDFARGDYDAAEELFQRALSIDQQNLDPRHPRLATRLMGLAEVLRLKGEYERADPLYEQRSRFVNARWAPRIHRSPTR